MIDILKITLITMISFCSFSYASEKYHIDHLGTLAQHEQFHIRALNNNGTVMGTYLNEKDGLYGFFIKEQDEEMFIYCNKGGPGFQPAYHALNDFNECAGRSGDKIFKWSQHTGLEYLDLAEHRHSHLGVDGITNEGEVIICHWNKNKTMVISGIWDGTTLSYFDKDHPLDAAIREKGYDLIGIKLLKYFNPGLYAGTFKFVEKRHPLTKEVACISEKIFVWIDGKLYVFNPETENDFYMHLADFTPSGDALILFQSKNSNDDVREYKSGIWHPKSGTHDSIENLIGYRLNDRGHILGTMYSEKGYETVFFNEKIYTIQELCGIDYSAPYSEDLGWEDLSSSSSLVSLNENDQILCEGLSWNKWYPVLLSPENKNLAP